MRDRIHHVDFLRIGFAFLAKIGADEPVSAEENFALFGTVTKTVKPAFIAFLTIIDDEISTCWRNRRRG